MKLSDIFLGNRQTIETPKTEQTDNAQTAALNRQIKSLVPGQTIQGEIVSKDGTQVQIKISDDMFMNARLEQNMNLEVGKNMTFEVRNNGSVLSLSPLFANMSTDENTFKALDMAQLPVNNTTVEMTDLMMKAGLAVDKNSLQQVYREINLYPDSDISDIVDLHKLSLPVNDENVEQIASYKNFTYQILNGMTQVTSELDSLMNSMIASGDTENAAKLFDSLISIALNDETVTAAEETGQGADTATQAQNVSQVITDVITEKGTEPDAAQKGVFVDTQKPQANTSAADKALAMLEQLTDKKTVNAESTTKSETIPELLTRLTGQDINPQTDTEALLKMSQEVLEKALSTHDTKTVNELTGNQELKNILNENLKKAVTISPEEVSDSKKVEELYRRIDRQLKGISQALENSGSESSGAYKAVTNMSQNIDFMHQLNQMYAYVQLPLRLNQGNAHGELYVYTNRKNLAAKDGKVSALLHLDMEHLGPVDVYVALENTNVSTKFYVQDDSMLDFLSEHMDILTERLNKRGYNCSCDMQVRESGNEEGGVKTILKQEGQTALAQYAFDVRA
jgi:hypothetical protein